MKFNFSKQFDSKKLVALALGGAGSAAFDKFVTPKLPNSLQAAPDLVKIAGGALIPMFVKNDIVKSVGDGLITVGAANLFANKIFGGISGVGKSSNLGKYYRKLRIGGTAPAQVAVGLAEGVPGAATAAVNNIVS